VRRTRPCLEELSLELEVFFLREFGGCHADMLDVKNAVALREASVVHDARIPARH
jgi:hypothetical protein